MLITSGVHARELPPPELVARFVETLMAGYDVDADIASILDRTEVHAILYVNPDGRHVAERRPDLQWRKTLKPGNYGGGGKGCDDVESYGVDINRNFDFAWGDESGASDDPCMDDYHGESAMSEPETRAVAGYAR